MRLCKMHTLPKKLIIFFVTINHNFHLQIDNIIGGSIYIKTKSKSVMANMAMIL